MVERSTSLSFVLFTVSADLELMAIVNSTSAVEQFCSSPPNLLHDAVSYGSICSFALPGSSSHH
jgi:hypothetical protein